MANGREDLFNISFKVLEIGRIAEYISMTAVQLGEIESSSSKIKQQSTSFDYLFMFLQNYFFSS